MDSIAIVGGGIGGLASAILLARAGREVTVYEQAKVSGPVGAGFLLQPPGQLVLEKLGILDEISKQAVPILGLQSQTAKGRKILDLSYRDLKGAPRQGLGIQRSTIYEALLREAVNSDGVTIVWGAKVASIDAKNSTVSIVVNSSEIKTHTLCILASGANSNLASECFPDRIGRPYDWGCLWTTFTLPQGLSPNMLHQRCEGAKKMMGILPVRRTGEAFEAALYWSINGEAIEGMNEQNFEKIKDDILGFWPEASSSVEPLTFTDFIPARYRDVWTPKPYSSRLVAIGDVSHGTSPQLGQGCTMALLDAYYLVKCLNEKNLSLENALESWWRTRRYQLAYVRQLSRILTPLFQSESRSASFFRDWVVAPVGRMPIFNKLQLKTLASEVFLN